LAGGFPDLMSGIDTIRMKLWAKHGI